MHNYLGAKGSLRLETLAGSCRDIASEIMKQHRKSAAPSEACVIENVRGLQSCLGDVIAALRWCGDYAIAVTTIDPFLCCTGLRLSVVDCGGLFIKGLPPLPCARSSMFWGFGADSGCNGPQVSAM